MDFPFKLPTKGKKKTNLKKNPTIIDIIKSAKEKEFTEQILSDSSEFMEK